MDRQNHAFGGLLGQGNGMQSQSAVCQHRQMSTQGRNSHFGLGPRRQHRSEPLNGEAERKNCGLGTCRPRDTGLITDHQDSRYWNYQTWPGQELWLSASWR